MPTKSIDGNIILHSKSYQTNHCSTTTHVHSAHTTHTANSTRNDNYKWFSALALLCAGVLEFQGVLKQ